MSRHSYATIQIALGTDPTFDKSSLVSTDKLSCHVIVTTKDGVELLNKWLVYAKSVVYLCPAGATGTTAEGKTISYPTGSDSNDGQSPETAVRTWKGAYSKLEKNGSWDDNTIVLMGTSDENVTNNTDNGFSSTGYWATNNSGHGNENTLDKWNNAKNNSPLFKNATIRGSWGDVDYAGEIKIKGGNWWETGLTIFGDTRFQYITFSRTNEKYDILYCNYNNLEMGEGIQMKNYDQKFNGDGTLDGAKSTSFEIFGGTLNDARFRPLYKDDNLKKMEE